MPLTFAAYRGLFLEGHQPCNYRQTSHRDRIGQGKSTKLQRCQLQGVARGEESCATQVQVRYRCLSHRGLHPNYTLSVFRGADDVVAKALGYGLKVWNTSKLDSVLSRCLDMTSVLVSNPPPPKTAPTQKLERLLSKEKHYGPADRDPNQKRHDYRYFSKGSFFVLVEDMRGEVATIAAHEYPAPKDKGKAPWPVLHCHPHARGPFIAFDEKEKLRWERAQQKKLEEKGKPEPEQKAATRPRTSLASKLKFSSRNRSLHGDLRRSVSLNNLRRKGQSPPEVLDQDGEGDVFDSTANASGYISAAAHMAASGNSVGITSTTGTTSTAGGFRTSTLSLGIEMAMKRQIVTSKKATQANKPETKRLGNMDPPSTLPTKHGQGLLKRSKSTSFKPPKREEGTKPGYCESCRQKFDDFKTVRLWFASPKVVAHGMPAAYHLKQTSTLC